MGNDRPVRVGMLIGSHQPKTATSHRLADNAGEDYDGRSVGEIPRMVAMQQKQNDELLDAICRLEDALASVMFSGVSGGVAGDVAEDPNARSNGANSSLGAYMLDNIKKTERHTGMVNSLINRLAL